MTPPAVTPETAVKSGAGLPQSRQFTFEEYCDYEDGTDNCYELVEGYLQLMTSPAGLHIAICEFLVYVFNKLFADHQNQLRAAKDVGVRISKNTSRIVDVCVNAEQRWQTLSQPGERGIFLLAQTPLLVVEVTSTNEKDDYEKKYREYASIGISEYWIVNSRREHLRVCTPTHPGGPYHYREFVKGEPIISSVLPQLALTVDEVLNPDAVRQLIEQDQAQQAVAVKQVQQQAIAAAQQAAEAIEQARQSEQQAAEAIEQAQQSEQRAAALEAMLARYRLQFGDLDANSDPS